MIRPRPLLAVLALSVLGLAAACGDTTADEGAEPTGSTASSDAAGGLGADPMATDCTTAAGETVIVEIPEFMFEPTPVAVSTCDSVAWRNVHDQAHTSTGQGDETWNSGNIQPGTMSEPVLFNTPGDHRYICALHPFMKGVVQVT